MHNGFWLERMYQITNSEIQRRSQYGMHVAYFYIDLCSEISTPKNKATTIETNYSQNSAGKD